MTILPLQDRLRKQMESQWTSKLETEIKGRIGWYR